MLHSAIQRKGIVNLLDKLY